MRSAEQRTNVSWGRLPPVPGREQDAIRPVKEKRSRREEKSLMRSS
jgi:hypothetical protein